VAESSRGSDGPLRGDPGAPDRLSVAIELASDALRASPAGILTDFDGTLSPIVAEPSRARLVEGAGRALGQLVGALAVVAVVTGRAPLEARTFVGTGGILVAGNHGTEWLEPGEDAPAPSPHAARVRPLLQAIAARVPELPGVVLEDKGLSMTVHLRSTPDPVAAERVVRRRIGASPPEIEIRAGRRSLEIRPTGIGDKGAAVRAIVERFDLNGAVVLGDDVTDLDMFAAVADLRSSGRLRGAIIAVGGDEREVPAAVAAAADVVLASPSDGARLLTALAGDPSIRGGGTRR
jgi:trehalose 6-phosphate phosphatase